MYRVRIYKLVANSTSDTLTGARRSALGYSKSSNLP